LLLVSATVAIVTLLELGSSTMDRPGLAIGLMCKGLLVTYRMVEVNFLVSFAALLLAIGTLSRFPIAIRPRVWLVVLTTFLSGLFLLAGVPVILLWITVCTVKMVLERQWGLAILIAGSSFFPALVANGSPTHSIVALMLCTASVATRSWSLDSSLRVPGFRTTMVAAVSLIVLVALLRSGVRLPVLGRVCAPVLAEREKTHQLERIVYWWEESQYEAFRLVFAEHAGTPLTSRNAIDRRRRPPAGQSDLDTYLSALRRSGGSSAPGPSYLVVDFGGSLEEARSSVFAVESRYAGTATVRTLPAGISPSAHTLSRP